MNTEIQWLCYVQYTPLLLRELTVLALFFAKWFYEYVISLTGQLVSSQHSIIFLVLEDHNTTKANFSHFIPLTLLILIITTVFNALLVLT